MLALDAYFDESGTHEGSSAVTVAGYVSTPEQWSVFESEWRTALEDFGLDGPFHMTDCMSPNSKAYRHWTSQDRRFRVARLIAIANRHTLENVGCVIPTEPFNRIFSKSAKKFVGGPYGLAATVCFSDTAESLESLYPSARVAYIFESGAEGAGEVLKVFQWNYNTREQRKKLKLLSLKFEGKEFAPLQAADILAHQLCRHAPAHFGIRDTEAGVVTNLKMLRVREDKRWGQLDETELRKWAAVVELAVQYHSEKASRKKKRKRRNKGKR